MIFWLGRNSFKKNLNANGGLTPVTPAPPYCDNSTKRYYVIIDISGRTCLGGQTRPHPLLNSAFYFIS